VGLAKVCGSRPQNKKVQPQRNGKPVDNITENSVDTKYQLFIVHAPNNNPLTR